MKYLGDFAEDVTLDFKFTTHDDTGLPTTLAGTPAVSVYKANGTTQSTAGVTLTVDFDSVTGLHNVRIDTSADAFYATGADYQVVITAGTVDSISVVGYVIAEFSIENRYTGVADGLAAYDPPTKAELDSAVSPLALEATAQSILTDTGTTLQAELDGIQADTEDIQSRLPAALVSGRIDASVGAMAANTLTASALATDAVTEIQSGLATAAALTTVDTVVDAVKVTTDKLDDTLEDDAGTYRFTTNALEQGPSGSGLDAAGVRAAVGLASANLDTQLGAIDTVVDAVLVDTGTTLPAQISALELGAGSDSNPPYVYRVHDANNAPIPGAQVLFRDPNSLTPIYAKYSDALGLAVFYPDPGEYSVLPSLSGYTFTAETVTIAAP